MRTICLHTLASALILGLICVAPAPAATGTRSAPIGAILQATRERGEIDTASEGTTIYDGDSLTTGGANTMLARLGGPQMFLTANSAVVVHRMTNGFSASLTSGTVAASAGKGQTFQLLADGLTVQPFGETAAVARMTLLNATQVELTSEKGVLKVSMGGETDTIEEGKSYRLEIEPEAAPSSGQSTTGPTPAGKNRFKKIAIVIILGASAIIAWRALMSNDHP